MVASSVIGPGGGALSETGEVHVRHDGGVLRIHIDRPDRRNALDREMVRTMVDALEAAATDDGLRAVLVTAAGEDFCSGADWVATNTAGGSKPRVGHLHRRTPIEQHRLIQLMCTIELPVVCAVRGWAAGFGCHLALAADFTIAGTTARFWEPFGRRGFTPDSGGTWLLPRLVGLARAREMILLGREVSGATAAEWGLVHRAVDAGELDATAESLVAELAEGPTVSFGFAKFCLHRSLSLPLDQAMELEALALELSSRSADFREGLRAFQSRSEPRFEGR